MTHQHHHDTPTRLTASRNARRPRAMATRGGQRSRAARAYFGGLPAIQRKPSGAVQREGGGDEEQIAAIKERLKRAAEATPSPPPVEQRASGGGLADLAERLQAVERGDSEVERATSGEGVNREELGGLLGRRGRATGASGESEAERAEPVPTPEPSPEPSESLFPGVAVDRSRRPGVAEEEAASVEPEPVGAMERVRGRLREQRAGGGEVEGERRGAVMERLKGAMEGDGEAREGSQGRRREALERERSRLEEILRGGGGA